MTSAPFEEYKHLIYEEGKLDKKFKGINVYKQPTPYRSRFFIQKGQLEDQKRNANYFTTALLDNGLVVFVRDSVSFAADVGSILTRMPHYIYIGEGIYHTHYQL